MTTRRILVSAGWISSARSTEPTLFTRGVPVVRRRVHSLPMPEAIYEVDGDVVIPSEISRGPWSPHAQHGGAPSALLAGVLEKIDAGPPAFTVRLDRRPHAPGSAHAAAHRAARRAPGQEAADRGGVVVRRRRRGRARERAAAADARRRARSTAWSSPEVAPLPPPGDPSQFRFPRMESGELGFWNAVEMSPVIGELFVPGPAAVWFRLRVPVIAGEETLPLQRVAAVADFGNGVGSGIDRTRLTFINADVTVTLHRLPVGEWVGLDGVMFPERTGIGVAETVLHDERGRIGRGVQTVILEELTGPPPGRSPGMSPRALTASGDRSSAACRGWPCCAGSATCACWSSCSSSSITSVVRSRCRVVDDPRPAPTAIPRRAAGRLRAWNVSDSSACRTAASRACSTR